MTNIAFLVDGDMEKRFLSESCKGSPIRRIGNGDQFPARVVAKQVMTQIRLLSNRIHHFVLMLDLEKRAQPPEEFAADVREQLVCAGIGGQDILIVVKERTIEDWILADPESVSAYVGTPVDTANLRGKAGLSQLLRNHNIKYTETTVGFEMLKGTVCSRAITRSRSLDYLRKNFPAECWWLQR